ncbi:hypothetical protein A3Q56_06988 [Intoshia linei]|uniref:Uncharacterized protein n=1 Tax=Intoshia linei TaxID=1819745 RepID=A0A177ATE8_9BILA|nr:hypothetical protein A3Q56_06988 [Intoshia linei]
MNSGVSDQSFKGVFRDLGLVHSIIEVRKWPRGPHN